MRDELADRICGAALLATQLMLGAGAVIAAAFAAGFALYILSTHFGGTVALVSVTWLGLFLLALSDDA